MSKPKRIPPVGPEAPRAPDTPVKPPAVDPATLFRWKRISDGWRRSQGRTFFRAFRDGKRVTQQQAIYAKCASCCAGFEDGLADCNVPLCPLYPFMPYRDAGADLPEAPRQASTAIQGSKKGVSGSEPSESIPEPWGGDSEGSGASLEVSR